MRNRLYWTVLGGLSFWIPPVLMSAMLHQNVRLVALNAAPLAGVTLLGVASWIGTRHLPKWPWVLAGIYPRACLHGGPVGISSRPVLTKRCWRDRLDVPVLLVSSNDPLDRSPERDDFFGADRHGYAAASRGISRRAGFTVGIPALAVKVPVKLCYGYSDGHSFRLRHTNIYSVNPGCIRRPLFSGRVR